MNFLDKLKDGLIYVLKRLLLIAVVIALVVLVKWQIDSLYITSITAQETGFSLKNEVDVSMGQVKRAVGIDDEGVAELPVVAEIEKIDDETKPITINVPEGATPEDIANTLFDNELITSKPTLLSMIDEMGLKDKFVAGTYEIPKGTRAIEMLYKLSGTKETEIEIEILENATAEEVGEALKANGAIESTETFVKNIEDLGLNGQFAPGVHKITLPKKVAKIIEEITVPEKTEDKQ